MFPSTEEIRSETDENICSKGSLIAQIIQKVIAKDKQGLYIE